MLRIDRTAAKAEERLDGRWPMRTSDATLCVEGLAAASQRLLAVERGWPDMKGHLGSRPVFDHQEDRFGANAQPC